ncbi:type IV pilus modification protein PilV [Neisseria wadsworthii]
MVGVMVTQKQKGATLIEVLVSMLMLGLGVLVLLATQLRTVTGVREAENQTIVAQATQNLIEGMLMNPELEEDKINQDSENDTEGVTWNRKRYNFYTNAMKNLEKIAANCNGLDEEKNVTKENLALSQVCDFGLSLTNNLPDATVLRAHICLDSDDKEPTFTDGGPEWNCNVSSGRKAYTVVKVLWLMNTENEAATGGIKTYGEHAVYTYQARVTE